METLYRVPDGCALAVSHEWFTCPAVPDEQATAIVRAVEEFAYGEDPMSADELLHWIDLRAQGPGYPAEHDPVLKLLRAVAAALSEEDAHAD